MANSEYHNEPSHKDLHCLQKLFWSAGLKGSKMDPAHIEIIGIDKVNAKLLGKLWMDLRVWLPVFE